MLKIVGNDTIPQHLRASLPNSCPKCGDVNITGQMGDKNFDEEGWFVPVLLKCDRKSCSHEWHKPIYILGNGTHGESSGVIDW
jgi:hypothetical protein